MIPSTYNNITFSMDCIQTSETMTKKFCVVMTTTRYLNNVFFQAISEEYSPVSKQTRYAAVSHDKIWWQIIKHFWAIFDQRAD